MLRPPCDAAGRRPYRIGRGGPATHMRHTKQTAPHAWSGQGDAPVNCGMGSYCTAVGAGGRTANRFSPCNVIPAELGGGIWRLRLLTRTACSSSVTRGGMQQSAHKCTCMPMCIAWSPEHTKVTSITMQPLSMPWIAEETRPRMLASGRPAQARPSMTGAP